MLLLTFEIENKNYCLDTQRIQEVAPAVLRRRSQETESSFDGILAYRSSEAPIFDLSLILGSAPSAYLMSSRYAILKQSFFNYEYIGFKAPKMIDLIDTQTEKEIEVTSSALYLVNDEINYGGKLYYDVNFDAILAVVSLEMENHLKLLI